MSQQSRNTHSCNIHNGHVASCLCCKHLEIESATPAYSEYTPGDSASISCAVRKFEAMYDPDSTDMHKLQIIGQTCTGFKARRDAP